MLKSYFLVFVPIFVAVDVLGTLPLFMSLTHGIAEDKKRKLVRHSILTALGVAVGFLWVGKAVFDLLGITMSDFLVAGGAILFILSIRDLLSFEKGSKIPEGTIGVVPLAVPLIAGPAVLTTSLVLLREYGVGPTLFSLTANILLCGVVLHFAAFLSRVIGESGSLTLSKISNLLLGAIGVMLMRRGLQAIFLGWLNR